MKGVAKGRGRFENIIESLRIEALVVDLSDTGLIKITGTKPHITWSKAKKVKSKQSNLLFDKYIENNLILLLEPISIIVFGDFAILPRPTIVKVLLE